MSDQSRMRKISGEMIENTNKAVVRRISTTMAVGFLTMFAAACSGIQREQIIVGAVPEDYRVNHPITITETVATLDVPVGMETRYLPLDMERNVLGFANGFMQSGSDILAIVLPAGSANAYSAAGIGVQVEQILIGSGVPLGAIQYRSYPASSGETGAPLRLAYVEISASTEPCGPWTDNVARNFNNENYAAFGCATQTNLAAMVANPLDLLYPRIMTPPDAARRATALANYQQGRATATTYDPGFGVGITQVGQ